ncbi:MAG: hypothetical protein GY743_23230 [Planctomycetaceae bacterium]|nr:hypothetical protein [Planctomycetaceae bacterium]
MIRTMIKDTVQKFTPKSVGGKYLAQLEGTETLAAFERGGEAYWKVYLEKLPCDTSKRDKFKVDFFRALLGIELYDKTTKANGYEAAFVVHNAYITWGRSQVSDFTTKRYDE